MIYNSVDYNPKKFRFRSEIFLPILIKTYNPENLLYVNQFIQLNGPSWGVETGRRDGRVTNIKQATSNLPSPFDNITSLITQFRNKGLDKKDLVVLSGICYRIRKFI